MEILLLAAIIMIGVILLVVSVCKRKMEFFFNYVLRVVFGVVGIYTINTILRINGMNQMVGLNSLNVLTVGLLGLPGFALVYSLGLYFTLGI